MTDIFNTPEKASRKYRLFEIGLTALRDQGWTVEKIPGVGKSSVRRITKGGQSRRISIRTTQDTWIAFPRSDDDNSWSTLCDVDVVLAVSVDDRYQPRFGQVHMIEAEEMRNRFDRAYAARIKAGHSIQLGRGVWVSLYHEEANEPVTLVGAGAGLAHPPIARVPLESESQNVAETNNLEEPLTIADAKRRLAATLGVAASSIKITVEA